MTKKILNVMKVVVFVLIVSSLLQTNLIAQAKSSKRLTGRVEGLIVDKNGARVTEASVKIESRKIKREALSNDEGYYQIELPVGVYRITVYSPGFGLFKRNNVHVQTSNTTINVPLEVAGFEPCRKPKHWRKGIFICA